MDIDLLSKMVKELILDNDKVVLPGLGSFVAEIVPSTFSDKGYTINPPYRRLYFRSRPDQGEELAKFYSDTNQVELAVADKIVKDFIAELKSVLHVKKTVIFPGLGRLRATKENTVFFVADEDLDIYPDGFGLEPISLKTHQESREEVAAAVVGLKSILEDASEPETEKLEIMEPVLEIIPEPAVEAEEDALVSAELPDGTAEAEEDDLMSVELADGTAEESAEETAEAVEDTPEAYEETVEKVEAVETIEEIVEDVTAVETVGETVESVETVEKVEADETVESVGESAVAPVKRNFWKTLWKVLLWICVAAVALLAIYVAVSRLCPGILDQVLYTPEELQIIKDL